MKVAPILHQLHKKNFADPTLIHTGQHYDKEMSDQFFEELALPAPRYHLGVGSGSHAVQTAKIMMAFEEICLADRPDLVLVVGDVNSTLAATLVAKKMCIPCGHVEAGLRSGDESMPEEINRKVTDSISDLFFVTEPEGESNLLREGVPVERICYAGNVMIDTLVRHLPFARSQEACRKYNLPKQGYALLTLHRPSNVDQPEVLRGLLKAIQHISESLPVLFSMHPRTAQKISQMGLNTMFTQITSTPEPGRILTVGPLPYTEMLSLQVHAKMLLTDSGGLQEESSYLRIPCLTLRENTERPVTVSEGTNEVVGIEPQKIINASKKILEGNWKSGNSIRGWDGQASLRIVEKIQSFLGVHD